MDHGRLTALEEEEMLSNGVKVEEDLETTFFADLAVLCSERINQMTKTYDDLEAVTNLLEEKEKDLELAAKIGQSLLEQNKQLKQTNEFLEEQLNYATDQVTQLKHELQQKIDLLHIYTDNESAESGGSTPANERVTNWGFLQRKIRLLEEENVSLKLEVNHVKTLTQGLEEKEQQLLTDCTKQIGDYNTQIEVMGAELVEKQEQCENQQKQLNRLLKEMVDKGNSEKLARYENEELQVRLRAMKETQSELAQELLDLQERYAEVVAMLTESREEVKQMKDKSMSSRFGGSSAADDSLYDSLASELEASDSGYSATYGGRQRSYGNQIKAKNEALRRNSQENMIKVMETVRNSLQKQELEETEKQKKFLDDIPPLVISMPSDATGQLSSRSNIESDSDALSSRPAAKAKGIMQEIEITLSPTGERISRAPSNESLCSYPGPGLGVPGIPGTKDLEFAIRRLSLRRRVELEFARYRGEKGYASSPASSHRLSIHGQSPNFKNVSELSKLSIDATPKLGDRRQSSLPVPIRSRLMLVKSVEGSDTLAHWKELATPGGIDPSSWEKRPGIKVRGGNGGSPPLASNQPNTSSRGPISVDTQATASGSDSAPSSDLDISFPNSYSSIGGQFSSTPGTFSFVNSQILHPSDERNAATMTYGALSSAVPSSSITSASPPRDDATSTFSTALNLAQVLGERCVDLVSGIGGGWLAARHSPMTVPMLASTEERSESMASSTSTQIHSKTASAKEDLLSGLGTLAEEEGPILGLDQVKKVERTPEKKYGTGIEGVVTRAALKQAKH